VRVTGTFVPADGLRPTPVETVTLAIYAEETGGTPLWQETQTVAVDADGRYTLMLGSTLPEGLPLELFATGEARWLGRRFERPGEGEQTRVALASVPYALKASDADTLGGRPSSAYLLAEGQMSGTGTSTPAGTATPNVVQSGTVNSLAKYVTTADVGTSAVFENAGRVGIGTPAPVDLLHVQYTNTNGAVTGYAVQNLGNTATSYSGMLFYDQNGALGQFQGFNNVTHEYRINNIAQASGQFNGSINFMVGSTSRLVVNSGGNIGIGTTVPGSKLHVVVPASSNPISGTSIDVQSFGTFANAVASHYFRVRDIGSGSPSAFFIRGDGNVGIGTEAPTNKLHVLDSTSSLKFGNEGGPSVLRLENPAPDSSSVVILSNDATSWHLRVDGPTPNIFNYFDAFSIYNDTSVQTALFVCCPNLPRVGIGMTDPIATFEVKPGGSALADFWGTRSSARLKKNIETIDSPLEKLLQLRGVAFDYKESDKHSIGFIAEEVVRVLPEVVDRNPDNADVVGIDYSKIVPVVVEAVKEQQAIIGRLQERIERLEARLAAAEKERRTRNENTSDGKR
jgi:hypothetical protein